jgi:hypothetical protein
MGFDAPASFGLFLIAAGIAILGASFRIARLAHSYRRRLENLLQLASLPLDPLELPAAAWGDLESGGWRRLSWEGSWFGQPVSGTLEAGAKKSRKTPVAPLEFDLASGDEVRLHVSLTHADAWGESRLFADHLARVFVLLLETRLHARTEALSAALAERARLSLYLQHDMRNQAQWVLWVADDFASSEGDASMLSAAHRLRDNAGLARDRAERLIAALGRHPMIEQASSVELHVAARQAARLAGVEPVIEGEALVWVATGLLARALDNLFGNLAAGWRETPTVTPRLSLQTISSGGSRIVELDFFCPWPPGIKPLAQEKIFEPFASGRPSGLGLGLYQARKSLREAGGDLQARAEAEGLRFLLRLPASAP